jgi:hypothetical protein
MYCNPFVFGMGPGPTMYVPGKIATVSSVSSREKITPSSLPKRVAAFVKTESVRMFWAEIEPIVATVHGLSLESGWQKIDGVTVVR